jgi:large subunit ribosomal protein L29
MKEFKIQAIREMSPDEIRHKLAELREAMFKDRFKNSMRQLQNPLVLRETRRAIARMETVLKEHDSGMRKLGTH